MPITATRRSMLLLGALVTTGAATLHAQKVSSPDSVAKASGPLGFRAQYTTGHRYPVIDSILPGSWAQLGGVRAGDSLIAVINMVENMANAGFPDYNWVSLGYFAMLVRRDGQNVSIGLSGVPSTGSGGGGRGTPGGSAAPAWQFGPNTPATPIAPTSVKQPPPRNAALVYDSLVKASNARGPIPGTRPAPPVAIKVGSSTVELKGAATINENPTTKVVTITVNGTTITIRPPE